VKDRAADDRVRLAFAYEFDNGSEPGRFSGCDFQFARDESFIALLLERKLVTARWERGEFKVSLVIASRFALIFLVLCAGRADYHSFKRFPIPLFDPAPESARLRIGLRVYRNEQKSGQKMRADNCVSELRFHETPQRRWDEMQSCPTIFHRFRVSQRDMKPPPKK
jgi:hypothetical protein